MFIGLDKFLQEAFSFMEYGYIVLLSIMQPIAVSLLTIDVILLGFRTAFDGAEKVIFQLAKKLVIGIILIAVIMPIWMDISFLAFNSVQTIFEDFAEATHRENVLDNLPPVNSMGAADAYVTEAMENYRRFPRPKPFKIDSIFAFLSGITDPIKNSIASWDNAATGLIYGLLWLLCWIAGVGIIAAAFMAFLEFFIMALLLGVVIPFSLVQGVTGGLTMLIRPFLTMILKIITYVVIFSLFTGLVATTTSSLIGGKGTKTSKHYAESQEIFQQGSTEAYEELEDLYNSIDHTKTYIDPMSGKENTISLNIKFKQLTTAKKKEFFEAQYEKDPEKWDTILITSSYKGLLRYTDLTPALIITVLLILTYIFLSKTNSLVQGLTGGVSDLNAGAFMQFASRSMQVMRTITMASAVGMKVAQNTQKKFIEGKGMNAIRGTNTSGSKVEKGSAAVGNALEQGSTATGNAIDRGGTALGKSIAASVPGAGVVIGGAIMGASKVAGAGIKIAGKVGNKAIRVSGKAASTASKAATQTKKKKG